MMHLLQKKVCSGGDRKIGRKQRNARVRDRRRLAQFLATLWRGRGLGIDQARTERITPFSTNAQYKTRAFD
jgi:hypothetical protein